MKMLLYVKTFLYVKNVYLVREWQIWYMSGKKQGKRRKIMDKMAKNNLDTGAAVPSTDAWLKEAKTDGSAKQCGMYLFHNGVVRETAKAKVRQGADIEEPVVRTPKKP